MKNLRSSFARFAEKCGLKKNFNRAGFKNDEEMTANKLIHAIRLEREDLKDATFYAASYGKSAITVLTEHEVFKCPLSYDTASKQHLMRECANLKAVEGGGLPVPVVTCVSRDNLFYGMTRMKGVELKSVAAQMNEQQQEQLGIDIARAVYRIAEILPVTEKRGDLKTSIGDRSDVFNDAEVRKIVGADFDFCRTEAEEFAKRAAGRMPIMMLADISDTNVLVDPDTKRVTAILDFGRIYCQHPEQMGLMCEDDFSARTIESAWKEFMSLRPVTQKRDILCLGIMNMMGNLLRNEVCREALPAEISMLKKEAGLSDTPAIPQRQKNGLTA